MYCYQKYTSKNGFTMVPLPYTLQTTISEYRSALTSGIEEEGVSLFLLQCIWLAELNFDFVKVVFIGCTFCFWDNKRNFIGWDIVWVDVMFPFMVIFVYHISLHISSWMKLSVDNDSFFAETSFAVHNLTFILQRMLTMKYTF